jgi:ArsR family transcriptional regulator, lead/cadmium/zinc/bismuth-responsive transcriptional repressor
MLVTAKCAVERAQNLVSHHLRALRAAGLAEYRRDGKMALYSLTEQGRALLELNDVVPTKQARG